MCMIVFEKKRFLYLKYDDCKIVNNFLKNNGWYIGNGSLIWLKCLG